MIRKIVFPEDARIVLLYMKRFFCSTIHNTIKELPWVNFLVSIICLRHLQFQNKKSRKVHVNSKNCSELIKFNVFIYKCREYPSGIIVVYFDGV